MVLQQCGDGECCMCEEYSIAFPNDVPALLVDCGHVSLVAVIGQRCIIQLPCQCYISTYILTSFTRHRMHL